MSWNDKQSIRVIKYFRDKYKIKDFVETGTYKGVNAKFHSDNFERVFTCEKELELYKNAKERLKESNNVVCALQNSPEFLKDFVEKYKTDRRKDKVFIYLDAHFYDPNLPKSKGKFVILDELKSLKNLDCIIMIHDFDNNLGHITYDGISLDINLVKSVLKKINSNFTFYTNTLASCDIVRPDYEDIRKAGLECHEDILDVLKIAWQEPRLTFRGILYALPTKLTNKELKEFGLRKWG